MKRLTILFLLLILIGSGCRSTRKLTDSVTVTADSSTYQRTEKVTLDTIRTPSDTATFGIDFGFNERTSEVIIQEVTTDQGDEVTLNYQVERKPSGAKIKVTATTKPKEVIQQTKEVEIIRDTKHEGSTATTKETTVKRGISVGYIWLFGVMAVVAFLVWKFWPIIRKFIGI